MPAVALMALGLSATPVFIDGSEARELVDAGALVLDARGAHPDGPVIAGAIGANWKRTRRGPTREGRLLPFEAARARYAELGVSTDRPVLVYGAGLAGWGEEGRIWWDLVTLGHPQVRILDGGLASWTSAGGPLAAKLEAPRAARFEAEPKRRLRADHEDVLSATRDPDALILDARSYEEYWGKTPFLSSRGGHVPGAHTLHWKRLLGPDGRLRPEPELRQLLGPWSGRAPVVAYCTGGVRSAFVVAVLTHLGIPARNYDGSWWDWSGRERLPIERPSTR